MVGVAVDNRVVCGAQDAMRVNSNAQANVCRYIFRKTILFQKKFNTRVDYKSELGEYSCC